MHKFNHSLQIRGINIFSDLLCTSIVFLYESFYGTCIHMQNYVDLNSASVMYVDLAAVLYMQLSLFSEQFHFKNVLMLMQPCSTERLV